MGGVVAARRPAALVVAVLLVLEAAGVLLLNWILSIVVDRQQMSLAGLRPGAMSVGAWAGGAVLALFLLCCAAVLAYGALRDRAPGRLARIALICCAVVQGVVGALCVGLVGWPAFAGMAVLLALLVFILIAYGDRIPDPVGRPTEGPAGGGAPA
ncbi:hypothetical protein K2224_10770 [Streptomyces sp. BHT-5-2]|uniref:hypothetical protein n=1 Tax=unclassified Streptomyces TaxID=2593676 RepID=UPI001C8EC32B|nr:hypothetical protein [Streptomyces sp. BHT-5-2]QZL03615.1 hypothetical protein K2224_10770 [Streptomyces sp. BHT-5-2]